jgi:Arc/MetJ-type ribon-helix-helix transcriptional regulator
MTKRVTVSLPDDIAAFLERSDNASATVAAALRVEMDRGAATEALLKAMGFKITEEGRARWREKIKPMTAEQKARIQERFELLKAGEWKEDSAE